MWSSAATAPKNPKTLPKNKTALHLVQKISQCDNDPHVPAMLPVLVEPRAAVPLAPANAAGFHLELFHLYLRAGRHSVGSCRDSVGYVLDSISYLHYIVNREIWQKNFKTLCYVLRMHRPIQYLWNLNDYTLKGSILGTALKYFYLFFVLRIMWALIWLHVDEFERKHIEEYSRRALHEVQTELKQTNPASQFLGALYIVNKMFIPIGPSVAPANDMERIACLLVMLTGSLVVTGAAVASLSLVISIYMRPEEAFQERYRLIIKEMVESMVPPSLREKVETFYKMYWHKQKAVSATQLLPTYPPTLPNTIYTDIYFDATQKNRILCDLSYEFLSKLAKKMSTVLYIPGDAIIKRSSKKSTMIFIAYGDIEMVSAEDDSTAVLRLTRGSLLAGCAGGAVAACARAYVEIRAATFCITHALTMRDLWLVVLKHKSSILHFKRKLMALKEETDERGDQLLQRRDVFLKIADVKIAGKAVLPATPAILTLPACMLLLHASFKGSQVTHPYYLVFKKNVPVEFRFFDYVVTMLYVLDLIVYLSTGANVEEGVPITFSQTSAQQMRSRWFVLDVVGTLPLFEFVNDGHFAGINKLLRLPKVTHLLLLVVATGVSATRRPYGACFA
ncbi:unnamed protein product [Chilo suppressalis]|uniref:Cyclic nucleotide-binding domain-containing protein n=1 Tax=Chilo suppressalis TaxID=168631 RepID=A0ABN8BCA6_CHISP|nr:unnamed protein product [Chilo suppressalis]